MRFDLACRPPSRMNIGGVAQVSLPDEATRAGDHRSSGELHLAGLETPAGREGATITVFECGASTDLVFTSASILKKHRTILTNYIAVMAQAMVCKRRNYSRKCSRRPDISGLDQVE